MQLIEYKEPLPDAYLPPSMKDEACASCGLDEAYQKVANRLRDNGVKIEWIDGRPTFAGGHDASWMFMYPVEIMAANVSPGLR